MQTGAKGLLVFSILFLLLIPLSGQDYLLSKSIKLSGTNLKTLKVLDEMSSITGFVFTYDTKIIDTDKRVELPASFSDIRTILDSVSSVQSVRYSVIGKHIILFRDYLPTNTDSVPVNELKEIFITGTINDEETGEPLSYATIGISHKGKGTVTNNNGVFILKLPAEFINDTVNISYVGYMNRNMPVRSLYNNNPVIKMERSFIAIPEIIIRAQDPLTIINKALSRVSENYGSTPALLTGFYREGIFRKKEPQIYSEAVLEVFKSPYTRQFQTDQVKVLRSRKIENMGMKDTLAVRLKAGLYSCIILDGVKNYFDFTDPARVGLYNYHFTDMVSIDGEKAYVISFEQKPGIEDPLFKGEIYINASDYGIIMANFELNQGLIEKTKENFVTKLPAGYIIKPSSVKYMIRYRKINGRYFLSHVRGDLQFLVRSRKNLFKNRFDVFFEVAYTDYKTDHVTRFEHDKITPTNTIFTRTINGYDETFWKDFDFLKPEQDISLAFDKLKARLSLAGAPTEH
jgi:hypothetical protein